MLFFQPTPSQGKQVRSALSLFPAYLPDKYECTICSVLWEINVIWWISWFSHPLAGPGRCANTVRSMAQRFAVAPPSSLFPAYLPDKYECTICSVLWGFNTIWWWWFSAIYWLDQSQKRSRGIVGNDRGVYRRRVRLVFMAGAVIQATERTELEDGVIDDNFCAVQWIAQY